MRGCDSCTRQRHIKRPLRLHHACTAFEGALVPCPQVCLAACCCALVWREPKPSPCTFWQSLQSAMMLAHMARSCAVHLAARLQLACLLCCSSTSGAPALHTWCAKIHRALHNAARPSLLANSLDDPALACCSAAMCGGDPLRCRCSCLLLLVLHAAAHCCLHSALLMLFAFCSGKKWHV